ncbi:MAG: tol-pal system YbgF family protein [Aureispira sp.]
MSKIDKIKLIEAYHTGQLKGQAKNSFNRLLQEDPNFETEVAAYEPIFDGFNALREEEYALTLQEFENEYQIDQHTDKGPIIRSLRQFYYVAAAAAVLFLSVLAYQLTHPSLFNQHFAASESIGMALNAHRAANDVSHAEKLKKEALNAYQDKDYESCITYLNGYRQNFPEIANKDYQALVVLGVARLARGKAEKAIETLTLVMDSRDSTYRQEAEWMMALAHIKIGKEAEAKKILNVISQKEGHIYQQKALTVLEQL